MVVKDTEFSKDSSRKTIRMKIERILGFIILFAGILIIGVILYASFTMFTGKADPPEIFSVSSLKQPGKPVSDNGIEAQLQNLIGEQFENILPASTIPQLLNLSVWSMFAGLGIFAGTQLASLGIKLLKT